MLSNKLVLMSVTILCIGLSADSHANKFTHFFKHDIGGRIKHGGEQITHGITKEAKGIGDKFKEFGKKLASLEMQLKKIESAFKGLEQEMKKIPRSVDSGFKKVELGFKEVEHGLTKLPHQLEEGLKSFAHLAEKGLEEAGFSPELMKDTAKCFLPFLKQLAAVLHHPTPIKVVETIQQSKCYKDINQFANQCNQPLLISATMLPYVGQGVGTFCTKIDYLVTKFDATIDRLAQEAKKVEEVTDIAESTAQEAKQVLSGKEVDSPERDDTTEPEPDTSEDESDSTDTPSSSDESADDTPQDQSGQVFSLTASKAEQSDEGQQEGEDESEDNSTDS
jgi:hypothetical protein